MRADDRLQPPLRREFLGLLLELDLDRRAALGLLGLFETVRTVAAGDPGPGGRVRPVGARGDADLVGYHEDRVEADAELPDDVVDALPLLQGLEEGHRTRVGDRAQVLDQFLPRHADARVGHGEGVGLLIGRDMHGQLRVSIEHIVVGQHEELDAIQGI